jgi:predicted RNase H-related nuclease YkuK (DUF458 family)
MTPVEIDFDEGSYHDLFSESIKKTEENDSLYVGDDSDVFDDDETPFAALARDYFGN